MTRYVAMLRGIMPTNPNMRNDKLRAVFESLGFANVRTVIGSGNVLFETESTNSKALETTIETALDAQLGLSKTTTIVRSLNQLQQLINQDPFGGVEHSSNHYLTVTFLKTPVSTNITFPHQPDGKHYQILSMDNQAICSVVDLAGAKTPDLMSWLERQFGKAITTRTYKTVERIVTKLSS